MTSITQKLVTTNNFDPRITKLGELSALPDPLWNAYTCTAQTITPCTEEGFWPHETNQIYYSGYKDLTILKGWLLTKSRAQIVQLLHRQRMHYSYHVHK